MALRISATGIAKSTLFLLTVLTICITSGRSVVGSRTGTRLWPHGAAGSGLVRGMMVAGSDYSSSWRSRSRSREKLVAGDEFELGIRSRKGWRKLLFARSRRSKAPGAPKKLQRGEASLSHFAAAFSFFSSMAKGSPSPSPATPSPGHN